MLDARTLIECIVATQTWEINFISHFPNRRPYHSVAAFILLIIKYYYYFHRMFHHSSETRDNRAKCESLHNVSRVHGLANSWLCNVHCQGKMQFSIIFCAVVTAGCYCCCCCFSHSQWHKTTECILPVTRQHCDYLDGPMGHQRHKAPV